MSLPTITIQNHAISRLLVGGNPFSGFSHQSADMDREMRDYYTTARIKATLAECEAQGINTFIGRADAHIMRMLREYWNEGGRIQWIAQTAPEHASAEANIRRAAENGAVGCFIHGGHVERLYQEGQLEQVRELLDCIRQAGMLAGLAAHFANLHREVLERGFNPDFHVVCFYNCGSLHAGTGERFDPADPPQAVAVIQQIPQPCIAYKILAAGRNAPEEAFRYAYTHIKPTDAVVVGIYTRHHPTQVADDVALVKRILG